MISQGHMKDKTNIVLEINILNMNLLYFDVGTVHFVQIIIQANKHET